jgi:DNA-binding GntR family transcriptional regulator
MMESLFPQNGTQFVTKSEFVAQAIRRMVMSGELKPGDRVVVSRIARQLAVSDTPVREAIKQLVSSGFLDESVHVGASVPVFTLEEVHEVFHMRAVLAGLAVRLNAPYYTPEVLARIDAILEQGARDVAQGNQGTYGAVNQAFHIALFDTGHFRSLHNIYLGLIRQTDRFRAGFSGYVWDIARSHDRHLEIRDMLAAGRYAQAAELIEKHELDSMQPLVDFVHQELQAAAAPPPDAQP